MKYQSGKGFTLLELLVVVAVIGILISVGATAYGTIAKQNRDAKRISDLNAIRVALESYRTANNTYPDNSTQLVQGNYIKWPSDPQSGNSYAYSKNGSDYILCAATELKSTTIVGCSTCGSRPCNFKFTALGEP